MGLAVTRRDWIKSLAAASAPLVVGQSQAEAGPLRKAPGEVSGHMTGARALVETLQAEGVECVYGIPGAQENELWDAMKSRGLPYLLVTHEFSAACMADGYARALGKPGVLCVVPGPGVTNCLSGLGEALLDSVPVVAIVGDVARGEKYHAFQVHELPNVALLKPVCKQVLEVCDPLQIPCAVRQALQQSQAGEPGPVAVVIPYNLLIASGHFHSLPLATCGLPWDEAAFQRALCVLSSRKLRIGIYAGQGCMGASGDLIAAAELLQAPVATSVSGKGVIPEDHPLAVGWGYGPQGTRTAEHVFKKDVDCVLAIGVKYSEVSTGFYSMPQHRHVIHVDASRSNLGRNLKTEVCVHADAGVFLARLRQHGGEIARGCDDRLHRQIRDQRCKEERHLVAQNSQCGADPLAFLLELRRASRPDSLAFVDVTVAEHWAAEAYKTCLPRTYFNPTDNQAMGWSIPAAIGAQRVLPCRQVVTVTGDGCMLMSALEMSTAAREGLPVKFFVLDDHAYGFMQKLQKSAYRRTTATVLASIDYGCLAKGLGVGFQEVRCNAELESGIRAALDTPGPVLTRVAADYGDRPIRWIEAVRKRYIDELSTQQKVRFASRLGVRSLDPRKEND